MLLVTISCISIIFNKAFKLEDFSSYIEPFPSSSRETGWLTDWLGDVILSRSDSERQRNLMMHDQCPLPVYYSQVGFNIDELQTGKPSQFGSHSASEPRIFRKGIFIPYPSYLYGAPFVTCTLLSTEAILSRQKSKMRHLVSGYAICNTKVFFFLTDNYFCLTKVTFVDKSKFCHDKSTFVQQKLLLLTKVILSRQK